MAWALVQSKHLAVAGTGGNAWFELAFDSNVTAGNLIDVSCGYDGSAAEHPTSAQDTLSNTYTEVTGCFVRDGSNGQNKTAFYAKNITGGACTVRVNLSSSRSFCSMTISEWSGGDTASPLLGSNANTTDPSTTTTPTSGSVTPGVDGALIISDMEDTSNGLVTVTPESTGFENVGGTDGWCSQYEVQTTSASISGDFSLSGARICLTTIRAYKAASSGTTLYFRDSAASGSNFGQLQVGGSAPSTATTATGWTVDTVGATNYALMAYASERASSVFSGTAQPAGNPDNSLGDCFRSTSTMSGDFATGVWTIALPVIAVSAAAGQDGRVRVRLWKSANATGTSPTEITSGAVAGTTVTNLTTGAEQVSTVTTGSITGFSMTNEYLFVQIAWEITGAAT